MAVDAVSGVDAAQKAEEARQAQEALKAHQEAEDAKRVADIEAEGQTYKVDSSDVANSAKGLGNIEGGRAASETRPTTFEGKPVTYLNPGEGKALEDGKHVGSITKTENGKPVKYDYYDLEVKGANGKSETVRFGTSDKVEVKENEYLKMYKAQAIQSLFDNISGKK